MILQKGANVYLQHTNDVQMRLYWEKSSAAVSPYCLFLDNENQIHQVIDGQEGHPFVPAIEREEQQIQYHLKLNELPEPISKIIFAVVCEGYRAPNIAGLSIEDIQFEFSCSLGDSVIVVGEIYRYQNKWKVRAVGECVRGNKKELFDLYQMVDSEEGKELPPVIVTVIDSSLASQSFYKSGKLQTLVKDLFIASSTINPVGEMNVYFYSAIHKESEKVTRQNFQSYIETYYPKPAFFNGLGLESNELPVLTELLARYEDSTTIFYFISAGEFLETEIFLEKISHSTHHFWEILLLNEESDIDTRIHAENTKIVPFNKLNGLNPGERQQTLLRPINNWRNRSC